MKKILVVFGGRSAEHDVSIITAHLPIMDSLATMDGYEIYPLYIAKDGSWYSDPAMIGLKTFQRDDFRDYLQRLPKVRLLFDDGLKLIWPGLRPREVKIDLVFPSMHGTYGEDGSLMGLLRMANVPFVGCDMAASAVAMDKVLTKQVTGVAGIPSVPYDWFRRYDWEADQTNILRRLSQLSFPLFVKPVHLGSSIAITKVSDQSELENAIEVALHYDDKVIVEEGVEDLTEVTLPIIGNDELQPALLEQPLAKFFDFEEKYLKGGKGSGGVNSQYSKMPADVSPKMAAEAIRIGLETYRTLGCTGISRVDMLIDNKTNKVYLNEVNTLPGSLYVHNWKQAGVSAVELVTRLISLAEERFTQVTKTTFTFDSDVLKQAGGPKLGS